MRCFKQGYLVKSKENLEYTVAAIYIVYVGFDPDLSETYSKCLVLAWLSSGRIWTWDKKTRPVGQIKEKPHEH